MIPAAIAGSARVRAAKEKQKKERPHPPPDQPITTFTQQVAILKLPKPLLMQIVRRLVLWIHRSGHPRVMIVRRAHRAGRQQDLLGREQLMLFATDSNVEIGKQNCTKRNRLGLRERK